MPPKIAVAFVHGIGRPEPAFADGMMDVLRAGFRKATGADPLVMKTVFWAPVIQNEENELWRRMSGGGPMDFVKLRRFMVDFAADALAYQPAPRERVVYDDVHKVFAATLRALAAEAGPEAPLCVISHSLGTVVASNYFYDLQADPRKRIIAPAVRAAMGKTPLDKGHTLALLYTLGSPLALWSLRYKDFGSPVQIPSPKLKEFHPGAAGGWTNIYDQDDVIGYPLKTINPAYSRMVSRDLPVNVGGLLSSWNPASHTDYWTDGDVIAPVVDGLVRLWRSLPA
jgi:hypothetical protein